MPEEFTSQQRTRKAFETLVTGEDAAIDLALAALLIAKEEYPDLDIAHYLAQLDALAHRVRELLGVSPADDPLADASNIQPLDRIAALNTVLFEQEHFAGNPKDYSDPRNSFLNEVLERRLGIPISLSLLYMEVGKRVGLHIDGIGMPLHFIVRCRLPHGGIYIDPFEGGRLLSEQECRERIHQLFRGKATFNPRWLEPVSHKQLLVRVLNNLKMIYIKADDYERALSICERILLLSPNAALEHRDRGVVLLHLKRYARALRDFSAYIELAPEAEDINEIRRQIKVIRQIIAMMN
jgi:regulator of sirC expression with transglutaminase-like and TPR domain